MPVKHVSIFQYALESLAINEFQGLAFDCTDAAPLTCASMGDLFLKAQHYEVRALLAFVRCARFPAVVGVNDDITALIIVVTASMLISFIVVTARLPARQICRT
jgi:hypothetical protein